MADVAEGLAFKLMLSILDLVKASGAKEEEAVSAIRGAEAMLSQLDLYSRTKLLIETGPRFPPVSSE
jgi:hypothetical protein